MCGMATTLLGCGVLDIRNAAGGNRTQDNSSRFEQTVSLYSVVHKLSLVKGGAMCESHKEEFGQSCKEAR